ncbi:R3H domain-containing nucleic acid-binding protein [Leifsonia sp. NPDC077715]|uniref:Jag family protein n=1 Tax=Leifsonia sp. NPDC077715 TaxID=3155539 RepID=UPI00342B541F
MTDLQTSSPEPADLTGVDTAAPVDTSDAVDASGAEDAAATEPADLDREGDIAADYIEELLDIADIDGDIDIDTRNGRAYISVNAEDGTNLSLLAKADTVAALQELTRLAVQNQTGGYSRLILDIAGSRDARQAELGVLVDRAITKLDEGAAEAALPPMSSYERKLVHDIVSERGYVSNSRGEGRDRHTVITAA